MSEIQDIQIFIEDQDFNVTLTIEEEAEALMLIIEELNLTGGIRASFAIEMLPPESDPEVVTNLNASQPIYLLRIPRGLPGLDGAQVELDQDPVTFFGNQIL